MKPSVVPDGIVPKKYIDHPVIQACEACFDDEADNCSGFVKAVMVRLGLADIVKLFANGGQANDIVDAFTKSPWVKVTSSTLAAKLAEDRHRLVLAGFSDAPNGHVVVIVPGGLNRGVYPTAYWGHLNNPNKAAKYQTINWAWEVGGEEIDEVSYAYTELAQRRHGASGSW